MNKLKVLILDDEEILAELFQEMYESPRISITAYSDYKKAIADSHLFDLAFIDLNLPGTRGDKVANLMSSSLPKILLTGEESPNVNYNFYDILPKPYNEKSLCLIFDYFVRKKTSIS
jgi:CheY-like chemotaxis protein